MPKWLFIIYNGFIFISVLIASFITVEYLIKNKVLNNSFKAAYRLIKKKEHQRHRSEEKLRYEDGKQEKIKFLTKVDLIIVRSGLNIIFPFISTETYMIGTFVLALGVFLCIQAFSNIVFALIGILIVIIISYLILYFSSGYNYKKTEKIIVNFANLLENYSKTTDDIISIFQKVLPYTENPVRMALEECCTAALTTGQVSVSLFQLSNKIEHEKFKELIRNLEICSRYEANYAEIISESRRNLREYIAAKEKRKEMKNSSKVDILLLLIAAVVILKVVSQLGEGSMITVLTSSFIGNIILLYCAVLLLIILFLFFSIDK